MFSSHFSTTSYKIRIALFLLGELVDAYEAVTMIFSSHGCIGKCNTLESQGWWCCD